MGSLNFQRQNENENDMPQEIELFISILLRYPEVSSIRYLPEDHTIKLEFMFLADKNEKFLINKLHDALDVFHRLEGQAMQTCRIDLNRQSNFTILTVLRDVESMSKIEVGLIVKLLKVELATRLIYDEIQLPEEELLIQDELISDYFESFDKSNVDKSFIAVREQGKVFVYNN